jgi:hypothetical protein
MLLLPSLLLIMIMLLVVKVEMEMDWLKHANFRNTVSFLSSTAVNRSVGIQAGTT